MMFQKIHKSFPFPARLKSSDGKQQEQSSEYLVVFERTRLFLKPITFIRVAHFDFALNKWVLPIGLNNNPYAELKNAEVIAWCEIEEEYYNARPEDNEKVVVKILTGEEFIANYIKEEDIFLFADNDYYPAKSVICWSKIDKPVLIK